MYYSIGFNNDKKLVQDVYDFCIKNEFDLQTIEFFGSFPGYKSSLNRFYNDNISIAQFEDSVNFLKRKGFSFNYLLNSRFIDYSNIDKELKWLNNLGVDTVTISDIKLVSYLNRNYPSFKAVISIVYGLKTENDLLSLLKFNNISRVIFHQSINHDFKKLIKLVFYTKKKGLATELLANELCFSDCKLRDEHYKEISKYEGISCSFADKIGDFCLEKRKNISIISNSPWIRPEDIFIYEKIGIDFIKLAGRNCDSDIIFNCIKAYLSGEYNGNFFDLMDLDGKKEGGREEKRYLNNSKLDLVLYKKFLNGIKK